MPSKVLTVIGDVAGGTFVNEGCVRDGNLVSGRTWHDNQLFMPEFMQMLGAANNP